MLEGDLITLQFVALEVTPQIPTIQDLYKWTAKIKVPVSELTVYGWALADELYTGLVGAGPNFSQAAVVSALNQQKAWSANGLVPPIDWAKGHIDPEKHPEALGDQECGNAVIVKSGKLVPYLSDPTKPWTCWNRTDPTVDNPTKVNFAP